MTPVPSGPEHYAWKGGRWVNYYGYTLILAPDHPRAHKRYYFEHILIAEAALGLMMPEGALVHHHNEDKGDNRNSNLVVCQDQAYHKLLHRRARALRACGHADWRKCQYCKRHDAPENLYIRPTSARHRECHATYEHDGWLRRKEARE